MKIMAISNKQGGQRIERLSASDLNEIYTVDIAMTEIIISQSIFKNQEIKFCKNCNDAFILSRYHKKYCSKKCCRTFKIKNQHMRYYKTCPICGIEFVTTTKATKCCSLKCNGKIISEKARTKRIKRDILKRKTCSRCKEVKNYSDYYTSHQTTDGLSVRCKKCHIRETAEQAKIYRSSDEVKKRRALKEKNRRLTPNGNINHRMSSGIRNSILNGSKGRRKWETLVGYTVKELKKHLEKKFTQGMSWDKFINGEIHIDHIIPKSAFNYNTPEDRDFQRCWSLKNLQPMWAIDNIKKRNKLVKHFQPSLI